MGYLNTWRTVIWLCAGWLQHDSVVNVPPPPCSFPSSSSSPSSQGSSSSTHANCRSSRRLSCPSLSPPPFEKSNIGQKRRPNYPGILITAVNGRSLAPLSLASLNQYMDEHIRRGSGTVTVWLMSSCPALLKAFFFHN